MTTTLTIALVQSASGAATHLLDVRYAAVGRALCGATIRVTERPANQDREPTCTRCKGARTGTPPRRRPARPSRSRTPTPATTRS